MYQWYHLRVLRYSKRYGCKKHVLLNYNGNTQLDILCRLAKTFYTAQNAKSVHLNNYWLLLSQTLRPISTADFRKGQKWFSTIKSFILINLCSKIKVTLLNCNLKDFFKGGKSVFSFYGMFFTVAKMNVSRNQDFYDIVGRKCRWRVTNARSHSIFRS